MTTTTRLLTFLVISVLALAGCSGSDLTREAHPTTLADTAWRAVSVNGRPAVPGGEPTAAFTSSEVKGSSGCNTYGGGYTYEPSTGAISFGQLATTLMLCADPARNEIETAFNQALSQATLASMDPEGRLVLTGSGGEIVFAVDAVGS